MTDIFAALAAPFPQEAVSWRAQSMNKDGTKAMALAYIDARDVMRRLDEVVGPANWQDSYIETPTGTALCTISIRCDGEWVSKSDGAGATDVEAEKGRISDAFKRCAVKWGIGRYLYDLDAPWVPCESYDTGRKDKWDKPILAWRRWTADPWAFIKVNAAALSPANTEPGGARDTADKWAKWADDSVKTLKTMELDAEALAAWWFDQKSRLATCRKHAPTAYAVLEQFKNDRKAELSANMPVNHQTPISAG